MYFGTEDVVAGAVSQFDNMTGVSFNADASELYCNPPEVVHSRYVGTGTFLLPMLLEAGSAGKCVASEMLLAVTNRRIIIVVSRGQLDQKTIDRERTGLVFVGEIEHEFLDSVEVVTKKTMTGKEKTIGVVIESPVFVGTFDPVVELTVDGNKRFDDFWTLANQLVSTSLFSRGFSNGEVEQLVNNNWQKGDEGYEFEFGALSDASQGTQASPAAPAPPPPPPDSPYSPARSQESTPSNPEPSSPVGTSKPAAEPASMAAAITAAATGAASAAVATVPTPATAEASAILPIYLALDENLLAQEPQARRAIGEMLTTLSTSDIAAKTTKLALISFSDDPFLHSPLGRPSADAPTATVPEGPTFHAPLLSYLPELIDHDLGWFKSEGILTLRPLLMILTASEDRISNSGTRLFDSSWRYRPNIYLQRSSSSAAPIDPGLQIFFAATPDSVDSDPSQPLNSAASAIVQVGESLTSGSPTSLRFPQSVSGYQIAQSS